MKLNLKSSLMAVMMGAGSIASANAQNVDCGKIAAQAKTQIETTPAKVLMIVSDLVQANPSCACDVVKTAITITRASDELATEIARAAVQAAPDQLNRIQGCVSPQVAAGLASKSKRVARSDSKDSSLDSKDSNVGSKGGMAAPQDQVASEAFNPLDLPGGVLVSAPAVGGVGAPSSSVAGPSQAVAGLYPRGGNGGAAGAPGTFPSMVTNVLIPVTTAPASTSATGQGVTAGDGLVVTETAL